MTYATREQFLAKARRRFKDVTLPVSGLTVRIRSLMEGEKEAYEAEMLTTKGEVRFNRLVNVRRRLVVLCLVDENGDPILSKEDVDALKDLDGADLAHLQEECAVHCGFKAGDIEALAKNSGSVPVDSSPTA